jgi:HSP20 family protein
MNRMVDDMFGSLMRQPGSQQRAQQFIEWAPAIDVLTKDGDLVIRAKRPGQDVVSWASGCDRSSSN